MIFCPIQSIFSTVGILLLFRLFVVLQLWIMANGIRQVWRQWRIGQQQKAAGRYATKRSIILQQGLHLYADVQDCYATCITCDHLTLVQLRLSIPVKDRVSIEAFSTAFISVGAKHLISRRLRIRCLPGDLSHVVITG
jgi:hypothetical protein